MTVKFLGCKLDEDGNIVPAYDESLRDRHSHSFCPALWTDLFQREAHEIAGAVGYTMVGDEMHPVPISEFTNRLRSALQQPTETSKFSEDTFPAACQVYSAAHAFEMLGCTHIHAQ
jgi:hypothetical protein